MRLTLFLIGAIVLIIFAIIAAASSTGLLLGTSAVVWLCAALLSYFVDIAVGGWAPWGTMVREDRP
jgi:hypothetical protein